VEPRRPAQAAGLVSHTQAELQVVAVLQVARRLH